MTTLNFNISKILEKFKNLKSDAMPRAPRPPENDNEVPESPQVHVEDIEEDETIIDPEDDIKKKPNKKSSKSKKFVDNDDYEEVINTKSKIKHDCASSVNVQATGNVYNIVNSSKVRVGNDYYFGPVSAPSKRKNNTDDFEEEIEKDNLITLLMESKIKCRMHYLTRQALTGATSPRNNRFSIVSGFLGLEGLNPDHDYMSYISKNLGKKWQTFYRSLGFTQGKIETAEINAAGYDISEARYKLLLDWVNNDDDGTLGRLSTLLWEEGERSIVKELSTMYKKSKSKK